MATDINHLSVKYQAYEDCERVTISFGDQPVAIFFESDEDLAIDLCALDYSRDVQEEVFAMVKLHRMRDQFDFSPPPECARLTEERPPAAGMSMDARRGFPRWFYLTGGCVAWVAVFVALWGLLR